MTIDELINPPSDVHPNAAPYEEECARFSWEDERRRLDGLPGGRGLNLAYEAVDRHAAGPRADHVAFRLLGKRGGVRDVTYGELARRTNGLARVLDRLGVQAGDRVFVLLPRVLELYVTVLGTVKHRSVVCTLFSAFGPEPIRQRMALGSARALVTTPALYRRKVAAIRSSLPDLEHVLVIGDDVPPGTMSLDALLTEAPSCLRDPADGSRGSGAAPLHQRDDGHAEGGCPRPRCGRGPPHDRSPRARSAP